MDLRKIMNNAEALFGRENGTVRTFLLEKSPDDEVKRETNLVCDDVCLSLKLWDGAFLRIHKVDPDPDWCDKTQEIIDRAMALHRRMGLSVTPKAHGMEHHVVPQMRRIPGGIGKLMENWVEQYHQDGYRYDVSYCRAGLLWNRRRSEAEWRSRAAIHVLGWPRSWYRIGTRIAGLEGNPR